MHLEDAAVQLCVLGERARAENAPVPCAAGGAGRVRRKLVAAVPSAIGPVVLQAEQAEEEQAEQAEQAGAEQAGAEQAGAEQAGAEQQGAEQQGAEAETEQPGLQPQAQQAEQQAEAQQAERPEQPRAEPNSFRRWGQVSASELAQKLQIDTTAISDFHWQFLIETGFYVDKNGRAGEQDYLLNARNALMAFVPRLSKQRSAVDQALAQINTAVYPSLHVFAPEGAAREMFMHIEDLGQLLSQHIVQAPAAGAAPAAEPEQQAIAPRAAPPEREIAVFIGGAPTQITLHICLAGDLADTFKIDTTVIPKFKRNAEIHKIVHGPPDLQGKWDLVSVMRAFNPTTWNAKRSAVRALAKTNMEIYPSRTEVQMVHYNVSLLNFLYQSY
jgi:hypothetical protein